MSESTEGAGVSLLTEYDERVEAEVAEQVKEPSITGLTLAELAGTITGFDRIAIPKMFGASLAKMQEDLGIYVGIFIWHRHQGMSDQDAFDAACNTTADDAARYFDDNEEIDDDHPETASGKDS